MPGIQVAASVHAQRHAYGAPDAVTPESIRAAPVEHKHGIGDVNDLAETLEQISGGGSGDGTAIVAWSSVAGKPTTFPPSNHSHGAADLSGVVKTINSLAPDPAGNITLPAPTWASITGKPSTFPPDTHTHTVAISGVTGLQTALDGKAATSHTHTKAQVTGLPIIYTATVEVTVNNAINGAQTLDFPNGMFSSAPVVQATAIGQTYTATTGTPYSSSVNIAVRSVTGTVATTTVKVNVMAVLT